MSFDRYSLDKTTPFNVKWGQWLWIKITRMSYGLKMIVLPAEVEYMEVPSKLNAFWGGLQLVF